MEYYFDHLSPVEFQRLVNALYITTLTDSYKVTPIIGADGGSDGEIDETDVERFYELEASDSKPSYFKGRTIIQVKHRRIEGVGATAARTSVTDDYRSEITKNIIPRSKKGEVDNFILITNVFDSAPAKQRVADINKQLLDPIGVRGSIYWRDRLIAMLDSNPKVWASFPSLFPGGRVPEISAIVNGTPQGTARTVKMFVESEFERDNIIRFMQINLRHELHQIYTEIDFDTFQLADGVIPRRLLITEIAHSRAAKDSDETPNYVAESVRLRSDNHYVSAQRVLTLEGEDVIKRLVIEGGPGHGKSTITQMLLQIYRAQMLSRQDSPYGVRFRAPEMMRIPFRVDLRTFADNLVHSRDFSIERQLCLSIEAETGGASVSISELHAVIEGSPILIVFDGLDEVGSDSLRDAAIEKINQFLTRAERLAGDVKAIVTTRPPAIAGKRSLFDSFTHIKIASLSEFRIVNYINKWLNVQEEDIRERKRIALAFERRRSDPHVTALFKNPMQLSVLLSFIRIKGEAFPRHRAQLYKEYFNVVIDRDIEKNIQFQLKRELIVGLHAFLGYKIHAMTEAQLSDGMLIRSKLLELTRDWLSRRGEPVDQAETIFSVGEDRLGLILALSGEGDETRYGFEIQPIREYFAAAYINEQIQGNANEVFQQFTKRAFWSEVALFLAGLRRDNEKVDLIARLKLLDYEPESWRQHGRKMAVNLLKEGVFASPPSTLSHALDYLFEAVDPFVFRRRTSIPDLTYATANFINRITTGNFKNKSIELVGRNASVFDLLAMRNICSVLFSHENCTEIDDYISGFDSESALANALVKIKWPLKYMYPLGNLSRDPDYWSNLECGTAANALWESLAHNTSCIGMEIPNEVLGSLVSVWAMSGVETAGYLDLDTLLGLTRDERIEFKIIGFESLSHHFFRIVNDDNRNIIEELRPILSSFRNTSLSEQELEIVKFFVELTIEVLEKQFASTLSDLDLYISAFDKFADIDGRASAISIRLTECLSMALHSQRTRKGKSIRNSETAGTRIKLVQALARRSRLIYMNDEIVDRRAAVDVKIEAKFSDTSTFVRQETRTYPDAILLEGKFVPCQTLMQPHIDGPCEWLNQLPIPMETLHLMTENIIDGDLPKYLKSIANKQLLSIERSLNLRSNFVKKIVKVIKQSDDIEVVVGGLVTLANSRFLHLINPELLLNALQSYNINMQLVGQFLLQYDAYSTHRDIDKEIIRDVVKRISENPGDYPQGIVISAMLNLEELPTSGEGNLLELEGEMQIHA
ncbi:NACHT domain-containing protein [Deinococcus navajonensis]|uniref:NACHT domain-containing protein n=1 Tax=Deinococcus navajonensis TaxID=309884 RepID=A0ABV8XQK6_9DEIO